MDCSTLRSTKLTKDVQFLFQNLLIKNFFCGLQVGILPVKTPFPKMKFRYFFPNFGRPPRIPVKLES